MDALKARFKTYTAQFTKPSVRSKLKTMLDSRMMDILEQLYWSDPRLPELSQVANTHTTPEDLDKYWAYKLDTASSLLTKSGIGRDSTNLVSDGLRGLINSIAQGEPFSHHPDAANRITDFCHAILRERMGVTADQVENCIKPYKYEVEVDEREWAKGRERVIEVLDDEAKRVEGKYGEIRQRVGGARRLRGLMGHVDGLEKWEDERRRRRISEEVGRNESATDAEGQGEMQEATQELAPVDAYKYSPAQIVDGEYSDLGQSSGWGSKDGVEKLRNLTKMALVLIQHRPPRSHPLQSPRPAQTPPRRPPIQTVQTRPRPSGILPRGVPRRRSRQARLHVHHVHLDRTA